MAGRGDHEGSKYARADRQLRSTDQPVRLAGLVAPRGFDIACAVVVAAVDLDSERLALYSDLAYEAIGTAARAALEDFMEAGKWEWRSPFAKKYVATGKAEGKADALLTILEARAVGLPDDARARLLSCTDAATLDRWLRRAVPRVHKSLSASPGLDT